MASGLFQSLKVSILTRSGNFCLSAAKMFHKDVNPKYLEVSIPKKRKDLASFVAHSAKVDTTANLGKNSSVWFQAIVGANSKVGSGSCVLEGSKVEENCTLGDACVVKQGVVIKKGSKIGSRVVIGLGSIIPENTIIKDGSVLVAGWNGKTVTDSIHNPEEAEEEALHVMKCAQDQNIKWSRTPEERRLILEDMKEAHYFGENYDISKHTWDEYIPHNPTPDKNPERRGLIFDK